MYDSFGTHRPREVQPGEYPEWDEALALVNRDLSAQLPERDPLCLLALPYWPEEEAEEAEEAGEAGECVHVGLPDGTWHGNDIPRNSRATPADALVAVAEAAQDTVLELLWQVWPVCIEHRLGMHPGKEDGRPVWWCAGGRDPRDTKHVGAAIGKVEATYRPRSVRRKERGQRRRSQGQ
ncbi:hypothetical protein ACWD25_10085 [Streptomyces sp. NPDC002920]